jgi:ribosomal protein L13E
LKKQLPIADPRHTKHFLEQVKTHYDSNDDSPEMQQENLWMLATSAMSPNMKVKWLHRCNQSPSLRKAMKFPKPGFSDNMFPDWLHKATWWA